ncbi:hypothetical protein AN958_06992 [Leucoagaricus sp. SymC.cos]|nr:hypothetical protein AN958_06992 [Leucoagaricus sp. SymC.cos]
MHTSLHCVLHANASATALPSYRYVYKIARQAYILSFPTHSPQSQYLLLSTMLFLALLVTLLHLVFSAPTTTSPADILDPPGPTIPLTIFGRELPECANPARYRTLQGIIWSCLATIFACTWVSMHPNVPDPRWSGFRRLRERIVLMFYAVIAPEFIAIWAFRQRMMAVRRAKEYNKRLGSTPPAKLPATPPATPLPNRSILQCIKEWFCATKDRKCQKFDPAWTLTHGFLFEMQGLVYFIDEKPKKPREDREGKWVDEEPIGDVGREEIINHPRQIPHRFTISEEEINDKSKGDAFTKLVVVLQTSWFIIQCIARWAAHLYVTELEIVTLAFAILNIIIYALWWNKPQNMGVAIRVRGDSAPPPQQHDGPDHRTSEDDANESTTPASDAEDRIGVSFKRGIVLVWKEAWTFLFSLATMLGIDDDSTSAESRVRFYSCENDGTENGPVALMTGVIGALFGGVHLIPFWLSSFPSVWQKDLWLASSVFIIVEPVMVAGSGYILGLVQDTVVEGAFGYLAFLPSHTAGFFLYIVCRMILIFLAFDSLRFLPPDTFVNVEWSTFFPHI